jgi:hypothetical protein
MTSKSIPREECVALAHRVSGRDRTYVDWVRIGRGDKTYDRYFDNLHALARGLARELVEAGHVALALSGSYELANPNDGRFQPLKKKLKSDWLPQAPELGLVEYLENLFVKERGEIRREEIERIGLALVGPHWANESDMDGKADACHSPKRKPGRPLDKREHVEVTMRQDLESGRFTAEKLRDMKGVALAKQYGVHKETASKARKNVLSEIARN